MQFLLFLFNVDTVNTRNRKCIRFNGTNVDTVDTTIDVHVFILVILVILAFYTGLWMLK